MKINPVKNDQEFFITIPIKSRSPITRGLSDLTKKQSAVFLTLLSQITHNPTFQTSINSLQKEILLTSRELKANLKVLQKKKLIEISSC